MEGPLSNHPSDYTRLVTQRSPSHRGRRVRVLSDGAKFRVRKCVIEDWNPPGRCKSPSLKTVLITVDHDKRISLSHSQIAGVGIKPAVIRTQTNRCNPENMLNMHETFRPVFSPPEF